MSARTRLSLISKSAFRNYYDKAFKRNVNSQYFEGEGKIYSQLFPASDVRIKVCSADRLARLITLWSGYSVSRVPRYNRLINRTFRPYLFSDYVIKYKEWYGGDFRVLHPSGEIQFTDVPGVLSLAQSLNIVEINCWFKSNYRPINVKHRDDILNCERFTGFITPKKGLFLRFQFMYQDGFSGFYKNNRNQLASLDFIEDRFATQFHMMKERILMEVLVPTDYSYIIAYDMLYYNEDLSHLPYTERRKKLIEFFNKHWELTRTFSIAYEHPNLKRAYNELESNYLQVYDKTSPVYSAHGMYKIRKRIQLPMIITSIKSKQVNKKKVFKCLGLGGYNVDGKLTEFCEVYENTKYKDQDTLFRKWFREPDLALHNVVYIEVDEFYEELEFKNPVMVSGLDKRRNRHREVCNVYRWMTI